MTNSAVTAVPLAVLLAFNLALGWLVLRRALASGKPGAAQNNWLSVPTSEISDWGGPELPYLHDDVNPLTEAEVCVIYGRPDEARAVLATAVRKGRLGAEEVARFWAEQAGPASASAFLASASSRPR